MELKICYSGKYLPIILGIFNCNVLKVADTDWYNVKC